jgi:hypothetical protein
VPRNAVAEHSQIQGLRSQSLAGPLAIFFDPCGIVSSKLIADRIVLCWYARSG